MTRVIICGSRTFADKALLTESLDTILSGLGEVEIVSGHAKGADALAEEYAEQHGLKLSVFRADWKRYGKAAGPRRNQQMLEYAMEKEPVVVAFWDGRSRGTRNMIDQATAGDAAVHIIRY